MMMRKFLLFFLSSLLIIYKYSISAILPPSCRFYPSCSEYSADAIKKHGVQKGILHALIRLSKCHPWANGGYDPVK